MCGPNLHVASLSATTDYPQIVPPHFPLSLEPCMHAVTPGRTLTINDSTTVAWLDHWLNLVI